MAGIGKKIIDKDIIDAIEGLDTCNPKGKKTTKELTDLTAGNVFATMYPEVVAIDYSDAIGLPPSDDDNGYVLPDTEGDLTEIFM